MDRIISRIIGTIIIILCLFLIERSTQKLYYTELGKLTDTHVYATIDGLGIEYTIKEASRIGTSLPVFLSITSGMIIGLLLLLFPDEMIRIYNVPLKMMGLLNSSLIYIPILLIIWIFYIDFTLSFEYAIIIGIIPFLVIIGVYGNTRLDNKDKPILIIISALFMISFLTLIGFTSNIYTLHHGDWGQVDINGFTLFKGSFLNYLLTPGFIVFRILNGLLLIVTGTIYFGAFGFRYITK